VPKDVFDQLGPLTLRTRINGNELEPFTMQTSGNHAVIRPAKGLRGEVVVEFELDKGLEAKSREERELGIIVASLELE
jgi:hypothetical protein